MFEVPMDQHKLPYPMTDPWDERYIYRLLASQSTIHVGKYTSARGGTPGVVSSGLASGAPRLRCGTCLGGGHLFFWGGGLEHGWSFARFPFFSITFLVYPLVNIQHDNG